MSHSRFKALILEHARLRDNSWRNRTTISDDTQLALVGVCIPALSQHASRHPARPFKGFQTTKECLVSSHLRRVSFYVRLQQTRAVGLGREILPVAQESKLTTIIDAISTNPVAYSSPPPMVGIRLLLTLDSSTAVFWM